MTQGINVSQTLFVIIAGRSINLGCWCAITAFQLIVYEAEHLSFLDAMENECT